VLKEYSYFKKFLGKKIGEGYSRAVHEHINDSTKVIKVARKNLNYYRNRQCNVDEFNNWNVLKETEFKHYVCPLDSISDSGRFLIAHKAVKKELSLEEFKKIANKFFQSGIGDPVRGIDKNLNILTRMSLDWGLVFDNIMFINDNPVMVDYHYPVLHKDTYRNTLNDLQQKYKKYLLI
jgi:hypothetical protein